MAEKMPEHPIEDFYSDLAEKTEGFKNDVVEMDGATRIFQERIRYYQASLDKIAESARVKENTELAAKLEEISGKFRAEIAELEKLSASAQEEKERLTVVIGRLAEIDRLRFEYLQRFTSDTKH